MSLIEQAAQRLEALRRAGADLPEPKSLPDAPELLTEDRLSTPERAALTLQAGVKEQEMSGVQEEGIAEPTLTPQQSPRVVRGRGAQARHSRTIEIDLDALAAAGYLTPDQQRSQIADEFRVIKRPIIRNTQGKGTEVNRANLVMVTSSLPGEGKSFVALNLAMSIASEVDSTVLLVDADVANPTLLRTMRVATSKGLLDLLTTNGGDVGDVLLKTNVPKLSILPAGTSHRRATEMLASETMAELVQEMADRYPDRIIVFDSPPLLVTTEARVLASLMGQIIMVVEADRTSQSTVMRALETIESCPVVLMMLNKAPRSEVGGGYYGYGAYGAGQ